MNGGGIPYVLFWILLCHIFLTARRFILPICIGVVVFTCLLEVGQLWNPEPIATFRKTKFGAALLGTTFVWQDFPPYFIAGALGYFLLRLMTRTQKEPSDSSKEIQARSASESCLYLWTCPKPPCPTNHCAIVLVGCPAIPIQICLAIQTRDVAIHLAMIAS